MGYHRGLLYTKLRVHVICSSNKGGILVLSSSLEVFELAEELAALLGVRVLEEENFLEPLHGQGLDGCHLRFGEVFTAEVVLFDDALYKG